jgi:hypothetical protein
VKAEAIQKQYDDYNLKLNMCSQKIEDLKTERAEIYINKKTLTEDALAAGLVFVNEKWYDKRILPRRSLKDIMDKYPWIHDEDNTFTIVCMIATGHENIDPEDYYNAILQSWIYVNDWMDIESVKWHIHFKINYHASKYKQSKEIKEYWADRMLLYDTMLS